MKDSWELAFLPAISRPIVDRATIINSKGQDLRWDLAFLFSPLIPQADFGRIFREMGNESVGLSKNQVIVKGRSA